MVSASSADGCSPSNAEPDGPAEQTTPRAAVSGPRRCAERRSGTVARPTATAALRWTEAHASEEESTRLAAHYYIGAARARPAFLCAGRVGTSGRGKEESPAPCTYIIPVDARTSSYFGIPNYSRVFGCAGAQTSRLSRSLDPFAARGRRPRVIV